MKSSVNGGKLRHWLKLYRLVETSDEFGGTRKKPVLFDQRWGEVVPVSAYKAMLSRQTQMPISHHVTMRYSSTKPVTSDCQIEWVDLAGQTRTFAVTSVVDVDERNRLLRVEAEERPNNPDTA